MDRSDLETPAFLARLRAGEHAAYRDLVRRYHGALVGTAYAIIGSRAQAEEVVQDGWVAVLGNIGNFEGRSSLASWLFTIVLNRARTRATREGRTVALPTQADGVTERVVPSDAFDSTGHWRDAPRLWDELDPERVIAGRELWAHVQVAIEALPAGQRAVLIMRDMEGLDAPTVCALLGVTPENHRVLLHRGRTRVRAAIDRLVAAPAAAAAVPKAVPAAR